MSTIICTMGFYGGDSNRYSEFGGIYAKQGGGDVMYNKKGLHMLSFALAMIGALNWGLIGLFKLDLVNAILGSIPALERIVYVLVGLSAVYLVATHKHDCRNCNLAGHAGMTGTGGGGAGTSGSGQ